MSTRILTARGRLRCLPIAAGLAAISTGAPAAMVSSPSVTTELLRAHNVERAALGLRPLAWDPALAAAAGRYADELARIGDLRHSPRNLRAGQGENLWMGTRNAFRPAHMVANWASEKRMFQPGIFPNSSRARNWADVGHYTQMIWPTTTRMGCGIGSSRGYDFLVCRYSPAGNIDGRRVP